MHTIALVSAFLVQICGSHAAIYTKQVVSAATNYGLNPFVLASQMRQESHCNSNATGRLGELGLMQLKRFTLATRGYDHLTDQQLRTPALNIKLGARHLRFCLRKCANSIVGALSLYKGLRRIDGICQSSNYAMEVIARAGLVADS